MGMPSARWEPLFQFGKYEEWLNPDAAASSITVRQSAVPNAEICFCMKESLLDDKEFDTMRTKLGKMFRGQNARKWQIAHAQSTANSRQDSL